MRYMRGLNDWLERDVRDRRQELCGVMARVDQICAEMRVPQPQPPPIVATEAPQPPSEATAILSPRPFARPRYFCDCNWTACRRRF
uniref:Uncharacterized protein n=1 Tax=Mycena chlorophos TaxID=658473 RepID=A0ABQ0KW94_MYCCL|nr:predicted protein [Mycena chlorophos]